ncbi:MAG: rod shape-determining protein MreD [Methylotenera sp.]|nr:rod shape-determining protein MreD [Methylotenera sp.]MDP1754771.1 rod shape-determining protein MreD [Methylotenera sp.]MDP1959613.1 rod shape-determining protein MreD [Methylotenera sp.]MDP3207270.1 rod shape-determining protein MreD [Methylotenera sp.]MDP3303048.1 rod shape-determining protein MreD [Methylotenera sp.]
MHNSQLKFIYLSLLFAFICLLVPWTGVALSLRPDFMLLVIIYWMLRAPNQCNVGTAWFVGLLVDLATGGVFGQYALAYTVTTFVALVYQRRLVLFNNTQQLVYVFLLLVLSQIVLLVLKTFAGNGWLGWAYFLPSITGILIWQLAVMLGLNTGKHSRGN